MTEDAAAMVNGYMLLTVGVIFMGSLLWLAIVSYANIMSTEVVQPLANKGELSMQTLNGWKFGMAFLRYWPVFLIIAVFLFAIVAGIYGRDNPAG